MSNQHRNGNGKRPMSLVTKICIAVILFALLFLMQNFIWPYVGLGQDRDMRMQATGAGVNYDAIAFPSFHSNDSRFFYFVTRNSVQYISSVGEIRWNESVNFTRPVSVARGDMIAVGEATGGRAIYVFNANGLFYSVYFDHPVLTFSINETGFLSVVLQYTTGYRIQVFNQHRTTYPPLFNQLIIQSDQLFPTAVEVSNDGRFIATAIADLRMGLSSSVQFRYMNTWDAWDTSAGLFAEDDFPGQIVSTLRFMDDNRLIVATTSQIVCFQIHASGGQSNVREMWSTNLQNALTHIEFIGNRHFAFITGERFAGEYNADPVGTLRIMNISGTQTGYFHLNRRATSLTSGNNSVIIGADRNFHALDLRGAHIWEYIALQDTREVIFLENTNTILSAGNTRAEVMRWQRFQFGEDDF